MALPQITVTARLVADPEARMSQSGTAVVSLRLAANARRRNAQTQEWEDGDTWWGRAVAFGRTAEGIVEAGLTKGAEVMVRGRVKTDQWEDRETGAKRSADQVVVEEIARVVRPPRQGAGEGGFGGQRPARSGAPSSDPWASGGGFGAGRGDEPPF